MAVRSTGNPMLTLRVPVKDSGSAESVAAAPARTARRTRHSDASAAPALPPVKQPATSDLRLLMCTWNVGNKRPSSDLSPWIPVKGEGYDVIVVGVQESKYNLKKAASAAAGLTTAGTPGAPTTGAAAMPGIKEEGAGLPAFATVSEEGDDDEGEGEGEGEEGLEKRGSAEDSEEEDDKLMRASSIQEKPKKVRSPSGTPTAGIKVETESAAVPTSPAPAEATTGAGSSRDVKGDAARPNSVTREPSNWLAGAAAALRQGHISAFVKNSQAVATGTGAPIFEAVKTFLGEGWVEVKSVMMWQTGIIVLAREDIAVTIDAAYVGTEATGILGVGQNKGGTAAVIRLAGTTLCFINTHLAAHMKHLDARNQNTQEILDNLRLAIRDDGSGEGALVNQVDMDYASSHCFWLGDMNYRIDLAIANGGEKNVDELEKRKEVAAMVERKDFSTLLACDQLRDSIVSAKALYGFQEAPITFDPTFKVEKEVGIRYKMNRVPSWCDRVLWKSQPAFSSDVECTSYSCHPRLKSSDHKPVSAGFKITCRDVLHAMPPVISPANMARLKFSDVKGRDLLGMDVSGLSDVYLLFHTFPDIIHNASKLPIKSRTKNQTLFPAWQDAEIPELQLKVTRPEELQYVHLVIVLMDYDALDADDRMGQIMIPLGGVARSTGVYSFSMPVIKAGVPHGELSGKIKITFPALSGASGDNGSVAQSSATCGSCIVQ